MNIGILTLYNANNYGAYLQAFALQKTLEDMGHNVEFININTSHYNKYRHKQFLSKKPKRMAFNLVQLMSFYRANSRLKISREHYFKRQKYYDVVVIGSDEIWNVKNSLFEHLPQFFGQGIAAGEIITYAPSCNDSGFEDLIGYPGIRRALSRIQHLSVRDENTAAVVEKITGKKPKITLDPTFLIDFEKYEQPRKERKFVLVYTYKFTKEMEEKTLEFARKRGLEVITAGMYNSWCDSVIPASPFGFLGLLRNADYVVTNTFHGTVLSIIYKKRFGVFLKGSNKIESMLKSLALEDRNLFQDNDIEKVMDRPIDYERVGKLIDIKKKNSLSFLKNALLFAVSTLILNINLNAFPAL